MVFLKEQVILLLNFSLNKCKKGFDFVTESHKSVLYSACELCFGRKLRKAKYDSSFGQDFKKNCHYTAEVIKISRITF